MKKNTLNLSLILILMLSFIACEQDKSEVKQLQKEFDTTMEETIKIHDEVMPRMVEINELLTELDIRSKKKDTVGFKENTEQLESAHKEMMSWMKSFSASFDRHEVNSGITTENIEELKAKNKLVEEYKASAEKMKDNVDKSITEGIDFIKNFK